MNLHNYFCPPKNIQKAIVFALLAAASMSAMAMYVKLAASHTNTNMTMFFRFMVSFVYIAIFFIVKKCKGYSFHYKTNHLWLHLARAVSSVATMILFCYSLKHISLVHGSTLIMTNALFIPLLVFFIFRTKRISIKDETWQYNRPGSKACIHFNRLSDGIRSR